MDPIGKSDRVWMCMWVWLWKCYSDSIYMFERGDNDSFETELWNIDWENAFAGIDIKGFVSW